MRKLSKYEVSTSDGILRQEKLIWRKNMSDKQQDFTLEENFERLEATIEQLEQEDIPLEDAFKAYTLGMEILKQCNDQIDRVEKQVLKLSETGELEELDRGDTGI